MLEFGRDVCGDLAAAGRREWLVTNGIGGYASGTLAGLLTRRYHGLLIAALEPPVGRTLLVTRLDETASYGGSDYALYANRWQGGLVEPAGFHYLERFHLEGTTPVWTFACADALLEKRDWMQPGANTTYVQYCLRRAGAPLSLRAKAIINYRDHHGNTHAGDWRMDIRAVSHGLQIIAFPGATPFYVLSDRAEITPRPEWYRNYFLSLEAYRGLDPLDDNLCAGRFSATLEPGDSVMLVASAEPDTNLDGAAAYAGRQAHEQQLIIRSRTTSSPAWHQQLVLAADQFIVHRPLPGEPEGQSTIAGYPWFADWGRDTMISLPGLTLVTGRPEIAARILRTYARFVDQGMLPNRFPDQGEQPEYNTVDATLWYFEAIRAYHAATGDDDLLRELFPVLEDIVAWHQRGTRYHIHVDLQDGLLYAGEAGVQLTWMDAKVGDWVVTPRIGKPVEVNALWYNALRTMAAFAGQFGQSPQLYQGWQTRHRAHLPASGIRRRITAMTSSTDRAALTPPCAPTSCWRFHCPTAH
jgi:predicted glycogen debranching enzyme